MSTCAHCAAPVSYVLVRHGEGADRLWPRLVDPDGSRHDCKAGQRWRAERAVLPRPQAVTTPAERAAADLRAAAGELRGVTGDLVAMVERRRAGEAERAERAGRTEERRPLRPPPPPREGAPSGALAI